ncbi:MAG: ribose-phosphate pyrophosphokinase [Acidobacteriia bacterium]|nr:ribose-phosphate pyrophosphokinase [Terriglobia bacterium]
MNPDRIKVFTGSANQPLTEAVCRELGIPLGELKLRKFSDGEINCQILENVRGADCFVVQPTCSPVEFHLMEVLCLMDALKRSSAQRITAVLPYYGYGRQDRKDKPRVPISAKLVASLLETAGADRIMALDLHAAQIQGFFDVPVDHLFFRPVMIDFLKQRIVPDLMVVSPDAGGVERARSVAKRLNARLAIIDKRREEANVAEVMNVIGNVVGKNCLIVDDLIDTAGTLVKGADALMKHGAASVTACATHAVLSGPAVQRIQESCITEVIVSDSIPLTAEAAACGKIRQLSVAGLLARAIQSIHEETSVSMLFE